jgi:outer membrane receptor protein involved in Fe transport
VFQPLLAALPIPNGPVNSDGITAPLTVAYSDPTRFDSYSLRIDYNLSSRITLFGRYGHSPSLQSTHVFSDLGDSSANMDSLTVGAAMTFGSNKLNDFRMNWGHAESRSWDTMVRFYGAVPPPVSLMYPPGYNSSTYAFALFPGGQDGQIRNGGGSERLRQLEFADTFSVSSGTHQLKFGADARQLTPISAGASGALVFSSYLDEQAGIASGVSTSQARTVTSRMYNYSFFGQDVWKLTSRLTLTNGLRWEINTPFGSITPGKPLYNVNSIFNSQPFGLVPVSTLWHTRFNNFAPRLGASYFRTGCRFTSGSSTSTFSITRCLLRHQLTSIIGFTRAVLDRSPIHSTTI